jgi:protein PhnA
MPEHIKGSTSSVKVGVMVIYILLVPGEHDIDCKIGGFGAKPLKSE